MRDYETLRALWTFALAEAGELRALDPAERALLERGSLDVLATIRRQRLERRSRWSDRGGAAALALCALSAGLFALPPLRTEHASWLAAAVIATLATVTTCRLLARGSTERLELYRRLGAARSELLSHRATVEHAAPQ